MTHHHSAVWGALLIDALADAGIETAIIVPGSRSTPLVVAAAEHEDVSTISLLDERAAGFFALGRAKRSRQPAMLISTSGTATANFHPAVVEADASRTPLLVCTADRPAELQECGANQTIDQAGIYGRSVRWEPTVPDPRRDDNNESALRTTAAMAVERTIGPPAGPVHLNVPFRKPLTPEANGPRPSAPDSARPTPAINPGVPHPDPDAIAMLDRAIAETDRGVIVCGPLARDRAAVVRLAERTGYPLLADPLSGLRWHDDLPIPVLGGYDAFLDGWNHGGPELIVRFGATPTSVTLTEYLATHQGNHVLIDPAAAYRDPAFSTTAVVEGTPRTVVEALERRPPDTDAAAAWTQEFHEVERRYWELVSDRLSDLPIEGRIAHAVMDHAPPSSTVFVSNSMPIRDVDRFGRPRQTSVSVLGNRGASGIDGIISTGLGAGSVDDGPTIVLTGDLACYHDLTGLLAVQRADVDATVVVINNDGGGIFHKLPIEALDPPFTEHFRTPHGLEFGAIADFYDLQYRCPRPERFCEHATEYLTGGSSELVELPVDPVANHRDREAFQNRIRERLP